MTSSPTREVDPDMLSAVLADHDERRPCPTPCRDQSERGGCLCAITAATLRALADERDAARAEAASLMAVLREIDRWADRHGKEPDWLAILRAALGGEAGRE